MRVVVHPLVVEVVVWMATMFVMTRVGPHPAVVLLAMLVAIHWSVSSEDSNLVVIRLMLSGGLLSGVLFRSLLGPVADQMPADDQSLWALIGTLVGWFGAALAYACAASVVKRATFRWRLHRGRCTDTDVRDLMVQRRYWGLTEPFEHQTIQGALKALVLEPATVGCWYRSGETPTRLAVALVAGISDQGLRAHATGTVLLDWGTVETLAALRRPL